MCSNDSRGVTVHKIHGSVCTSVLGSQFSTFTVEQLLLKPCNCAAMEKENKLSISCIECFMLIYGLTLNKVFESSYTSNSNMLLTLRCFSINNIMIS